MKKSEIKQHCDEIDEYLLALLDQRLEGNDIEEIRVHLRAILEEPASATIELSGDEFDIIDHIDEGGELNTCFNLSREFVCTSQNIELLEEVLNRFVSNIMDKVKNAQ